MTLKSKIFSSIFAVFFLLISALAVAIGYTSDCEPASASTPNENSMKAIIYRCYGGPEVLEYVDLDKPLPADNEVLVKVHAAGINPADYHYMRGSPYLMRLMTGFGSPTGQRMGTDFSGVVEAIGKDVTKFKVGDSVFGGKKGSFAEYVAVRENGAIALKPDNVSHEQAASIAIAAITALQAVRDKGNVQAGEKVLINGSSGGVGTFAVQIAKYLGTDVTGVNSTRNVEMVLKIGADRVIDYKKDDYITQDITYDVMIDMVANNSLSDNLDILNAGGRLVNVGAIDKGAWIQPLIKPIKTMLMNPFLEDKQIIGFVASIKQEDIELLGEIMAQGKLKPVLDKDYLLAETAAAMKHLETGRARGKIVVKIN